MASPSVMKLARMAESGKRAMQNIRARAKARERYALANGEVIVGGVAGGILDGAMGEGGEDAEVFGLPLVVSLGGAMVVAGFTDMPGAEHAGYIGAGLLAYSLGNMARDQVEAE